jgi:hypothetical protein
MARAGPSWPVLIALVLLALSACDQFDTNRIAESCVTAAMKNGEPFGNAKERAESLAQFRQYCAAASRRRP